MEKDIRAVEIHRVGESYGDYEKFYFPIDHRQVRDILGQILTQVEAMNLNDKSEKALKAIFTQMIWRWFDEVMDNSSTSSEKAGIRPIRNERGNEYFSEEPAVVVEK